MAVDASSSASPLLRLEISLNTKQSSPTSLIFEDKMDFGHVFARLKLGHNQPVELRAYDAES